MQNPNQEQKPLNALQVYMYQNRKSRAAGQAMPHPSIAVFPKDILELVALYMAMPTKLERLLALVTFMMEVEARDELNAVKDVLNNAIQARNEASEYVNPIYDEAFNRVIQVIGYRQTFWLHRAAEKGKQHAVAQLLQIRGINVNARGDDGMTALRCAALYGRARVLDVLIKAPGFNADTLNARDSFGGTALMCAAGYTAAVEALIKAPCFDADTLNARCRQGITALMRAARFGHASTAQALIEAPGFNADTLNARDDEGVTALMCAAYQGHTTFAEALFKAPGFDAHTLNARDDEGRTALIYAGLYGHAATIEALINAPGFDANTLNARDNNGQTALIYAGRYGHAATIEALIKAPGFDAHALNARDNNGQTALMLAVSRGRRRSDVAHLLFIKGLLVEGYASAEETMNRLSREAGEVVITPASLCVHFLKQSERLASPEEKIELLKKALSKDNAFAAIMERKGWWELGDGESNEVERIKEALSRLGVPEPPAQRKTGCAIC